MSRRVIISTMLLILFAGGAYFWYVISTPAGGEERIGFIRGVTTNGNYGIIFDEAVWLTGKEGEDAAIAAGICTEGTRHDCLPNDFIIYNGSESTELLEFATGIRIIMQTVNMQEEGVRERDISKQDLERLINDSGAQWQRVPYRIMIRNGLVTDVAEIYIP